MASCASLRCSMSPYTNERNHKLAIRLRDADAPVAHCSFLDILRDTGPRPEGAYRDKESIPIQKFTVSELDRSVLEATLHCSPLTPVKTGKITLRHYPEGTYKDTYPPG